MRCSPARLRYRHGLFVLVLLVVFATCRSDFKPATVATPTYARLSPEPIYRQPGTARPVTPSPPLNSGAVTVVPAGSSAPAPSATPVPSLTAAPEPASAFAADMRPGFVGD